jgi:hypothetical protein
MILNWSVKRNHWSVKRNQSGQIRKEDIGTK